MNSVEIAPNIFWVGYVDWNVRDFHGYRTGRGSTYNAYLIVDEKVALVDAVKAGFGEDLLAKVAERVDPGRIDYVISNHTEPDHSGELARVLAGAPQAELIASPKGQAGLRHYYGDEFRWRVVKTGDKLSLGRRELTFINTPMLHWPDSMFTYVGGEKLLFSMDAFGQHYATNFRFDDEVDYDELMQEAKKYYANIIMHLGGVVQRTLKAAAELDIEMVCPSHGVIWRKHFGDIAARYQDWAQCKGTGKVVVIYDSMWHSTETMAKEIVAGATGEEVTAKLICLGAADLTDVVTEVLDADAVVIGSPTLNKNMLPTVGALTTYLRGLQPKGKFGLAFGSYGWSGGGTERVAEDMQATGIELVQEAITCQYRPDEAVLEKCRETGRELARRIKQC